MLLATSMQYVSSTLTKKINTLQRYGPVSKFHHAHELKAKLISDFEDKLPPLIYLECGYMDKTSKRWIEDDQDLGATYAQGSEITIWCKGRLHDHSTSESPSKNTCKRKGTESENAPPTKCADMID